jgi:hypothetical protein
MGQYNADQVRNMQAQAANVAQQQFGAGQELSNAQNRANYGNLAQNANIGQEQFGANQAMTSAANKANYAQQAAAQAQADRQFGAQYGLNALAGELSANTTAGNLGVQQNATGLANLNAQITAGGVERAIEAEGIAADKKAFEEERANPFAMVTYQQGLLTGLPMTTQNYYSNSNPYVDAAKAATGVNAILNPVVK